MAMVSLPGAPVSSSAPEFVDVPLDFTVLSPVPVAGSVDSERLGRRVDAVWDDRRLGRNKALAIDAFGSSPQPEVARAGGSGLMPASTTKLLTAAAVLRVFGPETRFRTTVRLDGDRVFLVGGGDPQLTSFPTTGAINANASLVRLARLSADALRDAGADRVALSYDDSLFAPPDRQPFWGDDFLAIGVVAPITALSADGGRANPPAGARSPNPSRTVALTFARLLAERGIEVVGEPVAGKATGDKIAAVESPPLSDLVEHLLLTSDNTEAEILAHHVGREVLDDPTFAGGARATLQVLAELGIDTSGIELHDGSGLARTNRISPQNLLAVLRAAIETDPVRLWPVYTGLPVAGFEGSLANRFAAADARTGRGAVTGKTGTLTGTSTLAGLVSDRDGQLLTYAVMTNDISVWSASPAIDELMARVAGCRCATEEASPEA